MGVLDEIKEGIEACLACEACMEDGICPSYSIKKDEIYSPMGRLSALKELIENSSLEDVEESLLTCNGCGRCREVCPADIEIGELVTKGRNILYKRGILPKNAHKKIIDSILNKGNAVRRDEKERIIYKDPFYEELFSRESDTLLFLGCISSFFHPDAVKASISLLIRLGISFRLLKDEGCCGIFLYDGGYFDKAEEIFRKNRERFASLGIKKIILLCPSCYKCFKIYYPAILQDFDIEALHFIEVVARELKMGKSIRQMSGGDYILHEPCKMTRFLDVLDEPMEVLNAAGIKFSELDQNRNMSLCCGAGNGVRAYDTELSLNIANMVLDKAEGRHIVTMCPFCTMNLNHASKKYDKGIKASYISEIISHNKEGG